MGGVGRRILSTIHCISVGQKGSNMGCIVAWKKASKHVKHKSWSGGLHCVRSGNNNRDTITTESLYHYRPRLLSTPQHCPPTGYTNNQPFPASHTHRQATFFRSFVGLSSSTSSSKTTEVVILNSNTKIAK